MENKEFKNIWAFTDFYLHFLIFFFKTNKKNDFLSIPFRENKWWEIAFVLKFGANSLPEKAHFVMVGLRQCRSGLGSLAWRLGPSPHASLTHKADKVSGWWTWCFFPSFLLYLFFFILFFCPRICLKYSFFKGLSEDLAKRRKWNQPSYHNSENSRPSIYLLFEKLV